MPPRSSRRGKASRPKDIDEAKEFLESRKGEEFHTKYIAGHIQRKNKDDRPYKRIYDSVRRGLERLREGGEVQSVKKGRDVFWIIPSAETVDEQVLELERQLGDIIIDPKRPPPELHNVHFYIKKENCDKFEVPLSDRLKTLFNTIDPRSAYQRLLKTASGRVSQIRGGVMEYHEWKGRTVCLELYGTGSMNITINASEHPLSIEDYLFFEEWLDATLKARTGYSFIELQDITTVCWEWAVDSLPPERIDLSGKYAITVRQFDGMVSRLYLKHFKDGTIKERMEQVVNTEIKYDEWMQGSLVQMAGGVNSQFLIRESFEHKKNMEAMAKVLEAQGNALITNQNVLQKQGNDTEHLQRCIEKIAKDMNITLPKKRNSLKEKDTEPEN